MALTGNNAVDRRHYRSVVDGVGQGVGAAGGGEVGDQVEIDLEGLGPILLLGQCPVDADRPQPPQRDSVAQDFDRSMVSAIATSSRPGGPIWRWLICSTMEMACADNGTMPDQTR